MLWLGTPGRGRLHLILGWQKLSTARPFSFWLLQIIFQNWKIMQNNSFTWIRVNNEKFSHHEDKGDTFRWFHSTRIKPLFDKRETLFEEIRILRTNLRKDFWPFWSNSRNTLNILVSVNSKKHIEWVCEQCNGKPFKQCVEISENSLLDTCSVPNWETLFHQFRCRWIHFLIWVNQSREQNINKYKILQITLILFQLAVKRWKLSFWIEALWNNLHPSFKGMLNLRVELTF